MSDKRKPIIYHKLIRDRIPEIVKKEGKEPHIHQADESEFRDALGDKLFEEAQELYKEWKCGDKEGVLKEAADLLEILRTMPPRLWIGSPSSDDNDGGAQRAARRL
ncbi:MAG: hypothetical protein AB9903_22260 [Vulcanimicrobiota bacterium]